AQSRRVAAPQIGLMPGWLRTLPNGKPISSLGFGCSSVWASPSFDESRSQELLAALVEEGVNHFDTSPSYGVAERRLGRFLRGKDGSSLVVSTKVGTNLVGGRIVRSFDPAIMEASFHDSLRRLGRDHVDILYLHGPSIADFNDDVFAFLADLKARGFASYVGANTFDPATLDAVADTPIDAVMLQYNVGDFRNAEQID